MPIAYSSTLSFAVKNSTMRFNRFFIFAGARLLQFLSAAINFANDCIFIVKKLNRKPSFSQ